MIKQKLDKEWKKLGFKRERVIRYCTQKLMQKPLTRIKVVVTSVALRVANKAKELNVNNVYKTRDFSELEPLKSNVFNFEK